jgi:hypothetical protein
LQIVVWVICGAKVVEVDVAYAANTVNELCACSSYVSYFADGRACEAVEHFPNLSAAGCFGALRQPYAAGAPQIREATVLVR